jgi:hypothetical protein
MPKGFGLSSAGSKRGWIGLGSGKVSLRWICLDLSLTLRHPLCLGLYDYPRGDYWWVCLHT